MWWFDQYFVKPHVCGDDNHLLRLYKNKLSEVTWKCKDFRIRINGRHNKVIIEIDKPCRLKNLTKFLRGLSVNIKGNNNTVHIKLPNKFDNTLIKLKGEGNTFYIDSSNYAIQKNCEFYVYDGGEIRIGKNCQLNDNLYMKVEDDYKVKHKIIIGDDVFIAMDSFFRSSDGHSLLDAKTMSPLNPPDDIVVGNHCWIMARAMVLKGAKIPNNSAVAAMSLVNKAFDEENILLAGTPAEIIRKGITWDYGGYGTLMSKLEKDRKK